MKWRCGNALLWFAAALPAVRFAAGACAAGTACCCRRAAPAPAAVPASTVKARVTATRAIGLPTSCFVV
eukprot:CAMPEP_0179078936 /NCGR_PEP_ID=MMETSP0796-20121207/35386_1 /TAXON_ID=73915 /ORGANISM="Pyrodinium bahamense, Strain pbaha01" /LENGTH=68 /DNA_ID=CAMNT_0020776261 /DNA_START=369 /DNA_END=575 /DNA_ORIENTATION=+